MSELKWNHVRYTFNIEDGKERYIDVCDYEDVGSMEFTLNEYTGKETTELAVGFYYYDKGFVEDSCDCIGTCEVCANEYADGLFREALKMINQHKQAKNPKTYSQLEMEARIKKLEWTIAEQQLEIERLRQKELELTKGNNNE